MMRTPFRGVRCLGPVLLLGLTLAARAQHPPSVAGLTPWEDPLDGTARRAARLLQATTAAAPRQSPRAFTAAALAAAEQEVEVRRELERSGTALATDVTLDACQRIRDAELALAAGPAERLTAHERYWAITAEMERVTKIRVEAGQQGNWMAELALARACRLRAEDGWDRARRQAVPGRGSANPAATWWDEDPQDAGRPARLLAAARRPARLLAAVRHEAPAQRREATATAMADAIRVLYELEMSGQALVFDVIPRLYLEYGQETARDRETPPGERLQRLEVLHLLAAEQERYAQVRVDAGQKRNILAELFEARAAKLHQSLAIQEASQAGGRVRFPVGVLNARVFPPEMDPVEQGHCARARSQVMRPPLADLATARREALLASYEERHKLEREGAALCVDLTARLLQDLCDAETATARTPGQSTTALASYVARLDDVERVTQSRIRGGQKGNTEAELFSVRAQRLNAQRRLVEARVASRE